MHRQDMEATPFSLDTLVPGAGPLPCDLMGVGQNPGSVEVEQGLPFVGPAGRLLDVQLDCVGINRYEMYLTNSYKHPILDDREPSVEELESHKEILLEELHQCQPKVVVTFGASPTRWLCRLAGIVYRDLDTSHGIPKPVVIDGVGFILVPVVHPAAGLYASEQMNYTFYGLQVAKHTLELLRSGQGLPPVPEAGKRRRARVTSIDQLDHLFSQPHPNNNFLAIDTEEMDPPWGLTFSLDGVAGYQIYATEKEILARFSCWLDLCTSYSVGHRIILHHSLHDIPVLRKMGITLPDGSYLDTMCLAFLLYLEPQGLKALSWRHLGVEMQSYEDMVGPRDREMVEEYLVRALETDWDKCAVCGAEGYDPWGMSVAGKLHVRGGWSRVPGGWLKKSRGVRKKFEAEFAAGFEMCEGTLLRKPVNKRIERIVADMGKAEEGDDETEQGDL